MQHHIFMCLVYVSNCNGIDHPKTCDKTFSLVVIKFSVTLKGSVTRVAASTKKIITMDPFAPAT